MESAKPQKPAMTKKITCSEGFGRHKNIVIIKAAFNRKANTKMGTRPITFTANPEQIDPIAPQIP